jgi:hypothetical protein
VTTLHIFYAKPENASAKTFSSAVIPFFMLQRLPALHEYY